MRWFVEVVSLEFRRIAASRIEFWTRIALQVMTQAVIAYFLWGEIMAATGRETIGGYTLHAMVAYYVMAALVFSAINPDFDLLAREIYDGGLNRFIVYPISVFYFKFASVVARLGLCSAQIVCVWLLVRWITPDALESARSVATLATGLLALIQAAIAFFTLICAIELFAFWVESVWNLRLMAQFVLNLLGGYMIPISAFPEQLRAALEYTPFPWLIALPVRALFGEAQLEELLRGTVVLGCWSIGLIVMARQSWIRGRMRYSGVGL